MSKLTIEYQQTLGDNQFDINVTLPSKGISAIFGRSGAGKTSLINVVSGLSTPDIGEVVINGRCLFSSKQRINIPVHKRKVGYVFQESRLFPHYRVKGNLLYGASDFDQNEFDKIVTLLELGPLLNRFPIQLSGGEKQRVAIGRALLSQPDILLMDEPLASLDLPRKREVMPFLEHLAKTVEIPILYVSHSLNEVLRLAEHLVVIENGRVAISGPVEKVWSSPELRPWQAFSEQSSLFEARLLSHNHEYALSCVQLAPEAVLWVQKVDVPLDAHVRLQVRANDVSIALDKPERSSVRNILLARIESLETMTHGDARQSVSVKLCLAKGCYLWATITVWAKDDLQLEVGMQVYAQIKGVSVTQRDIALSH